MSSLPLLYSFRRCPYAIRARLALAISDVAVEFYEVDLKAKPGRMLQLSPKGTVPVLVLPDGRVIDESLDIMRWALRQNNRSGMPDLFTGEVETLIRRNDTEFKHALDRYKYPERHPEYPMSHYRAQGEIFLDELNAMLDKNNYLFGDKPGIADLALMPFVRQFAQVDRVWFDASPHTRLRAWLDAWVASDLFIKIMCKGR